MDKPTAERVVAVAAIAINPEGAADNVEGAARILVFPRVPKSTREETSCSGRDGESFRGLVCLETLGGVTKAVTNGFFPGYIAASLGPNGVEVTSTATQLAEKDSTFRRRENATEDKEPATTHSTTRPETVGTLQNSRLSEEKQKRDAALKPLLAKLLL